MRVSSVLLTAFAVAVQAQGSGSGNSNSNDEEGVQPSPQPPRPGSSTPQGCWSSSASDWEVVEVENIATGSCIEACRDDEDAAVAAVGGATCYCGSSYPPEDDTVSDSRCNYACPFYPQEACGGIQGGTTFYSVFNTGLKIDVPYDEEDDDDDDSSSTTASTTTTAASTTGGGASASQTNDASPSNAPQDEDEEDPEEDDGNSDSDSDGGGGGANVGGIVGGVVAGVAVIALVVGGAFWFIRSRRNREIEEEHRRNAAVNSFIAGAKPPGSSGGISMTDSRMDPGLAHRRMSDGSIADNQDYSRKILRVTNA